MEHEWSRNAVAVSRRGTVFVCDVCTVVKNAVTTLATMMRGRSKPNSKVKSAANKAGALVKLESGLGGSRVWFGLGLGGRRNHGRRDEARSALLCSAVGVIGSLLGMSSEDVAAGRAGNSGRACDFVWGEGTF